MFSLVFSKLKKWLELLSARMMLSAEYNKTVMARNMKKMKDTGPENRANSEKKSF